MRTDQLLTFLAALNIDRSALGASSSEVETLDRYTLSIRPPIVGLGALDEALCNTLVDTFQGALTLLIGGDAVPALAIRRGQVPPDLAQQVARVQSTPSTLPLYLDIDKTAVLKQLLPSDLSGLGRYYLFAAHAVRLLRSSLSDLEAHIFTADQPTLLVVDDIDLHYSGPILTIVGAAQLAAGLTIAPLSDRLRARLVRYHTLATEHINWVGFQLQRVTPLHCLCERRGGDDPALTAILTRHLLHLSVLYSANRTSATSTGYEAVYASSDRMITVTLLNDDVPPADTRRLVHFALWPYDGSGGSDRLTVLQNVFARELDDTRGPVGVAALAAQLPNLLTEANWNYRTFIDKQLDQHFVQLRGAREYVAETTKKVGDAVDTLTKGLTEVLLATLAVIIAALLSVLAKPQEEGRIIDTVMTLYAVYLALQALLRLGSVAHSIYLLWCETTVRLDDLRTVLGKRKVDTIAKPLTWRWRQFRIWFAVTTLLFVALGLGVVCWVPGFVRSTALPSPMPTSTLPVPTATPASTAPTPIPTP